MAEVPKDMLVPGDIIRFDYQILTKDEAKQTEVIHAIKETIASDDRLDYQGSEQTFPVDYDTGESGHILSVYAQVRKYRRSAGSETQEAAIGYVALGAFIALAAAAVFDYASSARSKAQSVMAVTQDDTLSDATKQAALAALGNESSLSQALGGLGVVGLGLLLLAAVWVFGKK